MPYQVNKQVTVWEKISAKHKWRVHIQNKEFLQTNQKKDNYLKIGKGLAIFF